jgi:hypothetical protein
MCEFLTIKRKDITVKIKSKGYYKLGQLIYEKYQDLTIEDNINLCNLYQSSTNFDPNSAKAWHMYALINYQIV